MGLFKFLLPDLMQDVLRLLASVDCRRSCQVVFRAKINF